MREGEREGEREGGWCDVCGVCGWVRERRRERRGGRAVSLHSPSNDGFFFKPKIGREGEREMCARERERERKREH